MNTRKLPAEPMNTDIWVIVNRPSPGIELQDVVRRRMPFSSFQSLVGMLGMDEGMLGKHMGISSEILSNATTVGFFLCARADDCMD